MIEISAGFFLPLQLAQCLQSNAYSQDFLGLEMNGLGSNNVIK